MQLSHAIFFTPTNQVTNRTMSVLQENSTRTAKKNVLNIQTLFKHTFSYWIDLTFVELSEKSSNEREQSSIFILRKYFSKKKIAALFNIFNCWQHCSQSQKWTFKFYLTYVGDLNNFANITTYLFVSLCTVQQLSIQVWNSISITLLHWTVFIILEV